VKDEQKVRKRKNEASYANASSSASFTASDFSAYSIVQVSPLLISFSRLPGPIFSVAC
jgi:hypothetical protein